MPRLFFVTFPNDDITVSYLFTYERELLEFAQSKSIDTVHFEHKRVNRKEVESFIRDKSPGLVVFNGHGNNDMVAGYGQEPLIVRGENDDLLKEKLVYSISCSSAKGLGMSACMNGAKAFIGYEDEFVFLFDKNKTATPLKDEIAQNFLEPSNALIKSLLKGNTVKDAYESSQNAFSKKIEKLLSSEAMPGSESTIAFLLWDKSIQTFRGNPEASF